MAFATAFQSDAFQNSAFQIFIPAPEGINPTGIGAVVDTRARDRAQKKFEESQRLKEWERRQAVERAFEDVFGDPKPESVTPEERERVNAEVLRTLRLKNLAEEIAATQAARLVDEYMAAYTLSVQRRRDEEAIVILMMAA